MAHGRRRAVEIIEESRRLHDLKRSTRVVERTRHFLDAAAAGDLTWNREPAREGQARQAKTAPRRDPQRLGLWGFLLPWFRDERLWPEREMHGYRGSDPQDSGRCATNGGVSDREDPGDVVPGSSESR